MTRALPALVVLLALVLAACTGGEGAPERPAPTGAGTATEADPTATAEPVPPPPPDDACYALTAEQATATASDADPVRCRSAHTARTVHVGNHPDPTDGDHLAGVCTRRVDRFLGGSRDDRRLSRFTAVWFGPDDTQVAAGATWFRCDLVAVERPETLAELPRGPLRAGVLDRARLARRYALCATAAPGTPGFARVTCEQTHRWRALTTLAVAPGAGGRADYPGSRAARRAGEDRCRQAVRDLSSAQRARYGWEWPTREQWRSGQRYGYCWVPA
ncbi:MAG: septum formation family protein [Nocardioides sp.]|nr:septum formation family protein [Nocardioides sp.]